MADKITGALKKELKEMKGRVKALPSDYQVVFYEISKYLSRFASNDAGVLNIQIDILDMFETGVRDGKDVIDIVGNDIIGFCDGLLGEISEHTWMGKMKSGMNQNIHKKLGRKKDEGK